MVKIIAVLALAALAGCSTVPASKTGILQPGPYTLKLNAWEKAALGLPGVSQTAAVEERGSTFTGEWHVSKMHGPQFRKALADGSLRRSTTPHTIRISLIATPEARGGSSTITSEFIIRDETVVGMLPVQFGQDDLLGWDAIRFVVLDDGIVSPPVCYVTGVRELRFFRDEWNNNPTPEDKTMNVHLIEGLRDP